MRRFLQYRYARCAAAAALTLALVLPFSGAWAQTAPAVLPPEAAWHWPGTEWTTATPEEAGMDARALDELVAFGAAQDMDSLVITRHGRLVREAYFGDFTVDQKHRINSATKGVVAALVGVAISQGHIQSTATPVLGFFGDHTVAHRDARKEAVTVQHLLDMTSGLEWQEPLTGGRIASLLALRRSPNWVQYVLDQPMAQAPGTGFNYNSGNSHLLATILARQTRMPVRDYAQQQLFGPLGLQGIDWEMDPQGIHIGGFGMQMRTRDMARIALLYLRGGEWNGRQLVPREWVSRVFSPTVSMGMEPARYADQWWSVPERGAFMAVGFHRQILLVMPRHGIAAAFTGRKHWELATWLDLLDRLVKPLQRSSLALTVG